MLCTRTHRDYGIVRELSRKAEEGKQEQNVANLRLEVREQGRRQVALWG